MKDFTKTRTRNWAFIMYPDSMPNNDFDSAIRILNDYHISYAVSPIHDLDFNADGEVKKPHYHVLLTADGPKSYQQIKDIADSVNASDCRPIDSAGGYYRYFTHMDNPEKAQYNACDIRHYNGFDFEMYNKPTSMQRYIAIKDMIYYIKDNCITEYCDFVIHCTENRFEWFKLLCDNATYVIQEYIKSFRNKFAGKKEKNED